MQKSVFVFYNNILAGTLCKLPSHDNFSLLFQTAHTETIGAITVREHL
jgi:hypothetical protein